MSDEQINNQKNIEERSATESGHEEDFAQLFEQSTQSVKRLEPGQRVPPASPASRAILSISTSAARARASSTKRNFSTRKVPSPFRMVMRSRPTS